RLRCRTADQPHSRGVGPRIGDHRCQHTCQRRNGEGEQAPRTRPATTSVRIMHSDEYARRRSEQRHPDCAPADARSRPCDCDCCRARPVTVFGTCRDRGDVGESAAGTLHLPQVLVTLLSRHAGTVIAGAGSARATGSGGPVRVRHHVATNIPAKTRRTASVADSARTRIHSELPATSSTTLRYHSALIFGTSGTPVSSSISGSTSLICGSTKENGIHRRRRAPLSPAQRRPRRPPGSWT
ncbi:MAG: hypothetical protein JWR58_1492, partial [Pseudonocardia sp.]|nr:hypothetical protein [Pseudonocardia sp.]